MIDKIVSILIVEDDEVDVMAIRRAFQETNISNPIYIAKDGIEALQKLRAREIPYPYIVLMDLNMPRMNGIDCMKQIRTDQNLKRTTIFALSTSNDEKDKLNAYDCNVAGYIVKSDIGNEFGKALKMLYQYLNVVDLPSE
jgi:CheY-like chemotaxis protein|tara:strand:+ start:137 stop:556 length:420 start_codon:yes stop_codon:yes gene_type:complete